MTSPANERHLPARSANRPAWGIFLATVVWIAASATLFLWMFDLGFNMTGEPYSPETQAAVDDRQRILIVVFVAGPALIAVFAAIAERPRTALAYLLVALTLLCWNGSQENVRDLFNPPPVEVENPGNDHCVPISGSDRTCPGG
jgi:hypothetical protein